MAIGEREIRIKKINELREMGINPYIDKFLDKMDIKSLYEQKNLQNYDDLQKTGAEAKYRIAGRVLSKREHGKLIFLRLGDYSEEIQLAFVAGSFDLFSGEQKITNFDTFEFLKKFVDVADFIGVSGELFLTKHGQLTLFVKSLYFLSKTVRPLPEKFHGLGDDKENRYRYRYLDFLASDEQGEQTELDFLHKDTEFKDFYLAILKDSKNQEWIETVQKVIKYRISEMGETNGETTLKNLENGNIGNDDFDYLFELFVKSNKIRDFVLELMKDSLKPQYLAAKFRMNTKLRFSMRTQTINFIRNYLVKLGFDEIDTPVLCNKASGALAKPFSTHHNAYDIDVYLRIAPETYLKRAIVAGYEKVFEFSRCFRNEGVDPSHIQDFTMLEFYWCYVDYNHLMDMTENMIKSLIKEIYQSESLIILDKDNNPVKVDFGKPRPRVSIFELIKPYFPEMEQLRLEDNIVEAKKLALETLKDKLDKEDVKEMQKLGWGNFIDFIYKKTARKKIIDPVFVINHPIELSPLARKSDEDGRKTDRFQLVISGWEVLNAYSELVDPVDQKERFEFQQEARESGDEEAHAIDNDYVRAMEHGMPPIAGWGSGMDRLVALLTTQENIRDVVMFPLTKPLNEDE